MAKIDRIEDWKIKITDMNMYIGMRDCYGREVDANELYRIMDHFGIHHAVCTHEYARLDPKHGNRLMLQEALDSDGRIGFTAFLDPSLGADNMPGQGTLAERLDFFAPEAVRISPDDKSVFTKFYWEEILDTVNALKLPLIIDCAYNDTFFAELPRVAAEYPDTKFILVHYGFCTSRLTFPLLKKCTNVYMTIESMVDNQEIEEIEEKCGVDKLLFGSAYPKYSPAGALGLGLYANISDESREKIMHKNWEVIRG